VKALVTGATGFVGGHLVEALVARGDTVLALARRPDAHPALAALGATPVAGSLENVRSLSAALGGVEVVYHLAGLTAAANEAEFFAVNEGGTRRLVEAIRDAAPGLRRLVYVSSQAALGPSPHGTPLGEDAECRPITAYGRSKLAGELAVRGSGLPWTVVRPSAVYGPGDREFLRLFQIVRRGIAPVFGTGRQELSLVFVRDLAQAIALAGAAAPLAGQIVHAAHREVVLSRDLARAAGAALGRSPLILPLPGFVASPIVGLIGRAAAAAGRRTVVNADKMAEFLAPSWLLQVAKAEQLMGWRAGTDVAAGMRITAEWYREHRWLS
jgi:dihydroflavonol-4-reductase